MKIMVANKDEYIDYFSKRTDTLNVSVLNEQENYIIHSIEYEAGEKDLSLMYSSINNLLNEQYEKDNYITLEELKEIDILFNTLNKEQCKIINAYAELNHYTINSLDEIKELIANIDDYQLLEKYNLEELGMLITEKIPKYEIQNEMVEFINYSRLAEKFLLNSNIKQNFTSYGLLINTRMMLDNDLIEEKITKDKVLKIEIVNRKELERTPYCNSVIIYFPTDRERIKEKIKQIDIDYDSMLIEDIQIIQCNIVNFKDNFLSNQFNLFMEKIIDKITNEEKNAIQIKQIDELCNQLKEFDNTKMSKFLAIAQAKKYKITDLSKLTDLTKITEKFEVLPDVKNYNDIGKYLVNETGHFDDISILDDYINYEKLAKDYTQKGCTYNGTFTNLGYLIEKEEFEIVKQEKEEEEFE